MVRTWLNERGEEIDLVDISFESILDRREEETLYSIDGKSIWIPNRFVGEVDEIRGILAVAPEFLEAGGLG